MKPLLAAAALASLLDRASSTIIRQVSFEDPDAESNGGDADARDAKIYERESDGAECFVFTSEAVNGNADLSLEDWKIYSTCDVFGEGPPTTELLQGDASGTSIEYTFSDASGDGSRVCFMEDLPGSRGTSIFLQAWPGGEVTEITDSEASGRLGNSYRCDLSRNGEALVFDSDEVLFPGATEDGQDHVFYTDDEGATFRRLVPDAYSNGAESKWGVLSGDGSFAAFHSNIQTPGASTTAWETYLWRASDGAIHRVTELAGKECNRTASFERLVEIYGIDNLTANDLATETKLGNGQTQCEGFAAAGELPDSGAGAVDVKDNPASISDDGRFVTFMAGFESATLRGTNEPSLAPNVSKRNIFLYDAALGITWAVTRETNIVTTLLGDSSEAPVDIEAVCCPSASSSYQRETCSVRNEMRQACCWQRPCFNPAVTNRISGNGQFIVFSTDLSPGDPTQIPLDWEIALYHVPSGQIVRVTDTNSKDFKDFYPSISRKGDVVAWTSAFDYARNESIKSTNQIFAAKAHVGCSTDATASNYRPEPDVEVCCEWDDNDVPAAWGGGVPVQISLHGNPEEMSGRVAFAGASTPAPQITGVSPAQVSASGKRDVIDEEYKAWCEAYVEQVRADVACALSVPSKYVAKGRGWLRLCRREWKETGIVVPLFLRFNPWEQAWRTCRRLNGQYAAEGSPLWRGYLTKTMKLDGDTPCTVGKAKASKYFT